MYERAGVSEICAYYERVLADRMLPSGKAEWFPSCDYVGDGQFVSRVSGQRFEVPERCRVVDARYLAPDIPALTPPPFEVADGVRVILEVRSVRNRITRDRLRQPRCGVRRKAIAQRLRTD